MYRFLLTLMIAALTGPFASTPASGATLIVSGGQLLGATGVDVGGSLFDVAFVDGTCIALFGGCDDDSDFVFQSSTEAEVAAQALLEQVFLDVVDGAFDTEPELTAGCSGTFACSAQTPYMAFLSTEPGAWSASATNFAPPNSDSVSSGGTTFGNQDLTGATNNVWAVWTATAVPEVGTSTLALLALLATSVGLRRTP